MLVEYETDADAFYVVVTDGEVARTIEVSAFVSVDVDGDENVVGLELLCQPSAVTVEERSALEARYPLAIVALTEVERLTQPSA